MQNKALYDLEWFQDNEVMIADYYDDTKNLKLFIQFFSLFWLL